jgi:hypothetical protein
MRLDARVRPLLEPAQWIRPTGEISERGFHTWTFPEPFIEAFSKSAQSQGVAQNQDIDAFGRRGGLLSSGLQLSGWLRLLRKQRRSK